MISLSFSLSRESFVEIVYTYGFDDNDMEGAKILFHMYYK